MKTQSNSEKLSPVANDRHIHMRCEYKYLDAKDPSNYCSEKYLDGTLAVGDLCLLRPQQINPTQMSVGKGTVHIFHSSEKGLKRNIYKTT